MPHDESAGPDPDGRASPADGLAGTVPDAPAGRDPASGLRLLVVPGVNPAKWLSVWEQRLPDVPVTLVHAEAGEAADVLLACGADAALLRLPVDRDRLSAIPLYTETTVVVVPRDHLVTAADDVVATDLADEVLLVPDDDVLPWPDRPGEPSAMAAPTSTAEAVEQVAAGVGVLVVPQSLARLHQRRDVTYRPVTDAPTSSVALAWSTDATTELVEELIGIVRGRTVNSSRGRGTASSPAGADSEAERGSGGRGSGGRPVAGGRGSGGRPVAGGRSGSGRPGSRTGRPGTGRPGTGRPRRRG